MNRYRNTPEGEIRKIRPVRFRYREYVVTGEHTFLMSLSFAIYKDSRYYWVLADVNKIINPFLELVVGDVLKIPHESYLKDF